MKYPGLGIVFFLLMQFDALGYPAVITSKIPEMNNSFPPPDKAGVSPDTHGCPRAHQGLFNEVLECIDEQDGYVQIAYGHVTYKTDGTPSTFWSYKDGIKPLDELEHHDLARAIPHPEYAQEPTIILTYPWKNFSLGTRLRHLPQYDTADTYAVVWPDYAKNEVAVDFVPRKDALREIKQDAQSNRQRFVAIINGLIDRVQQHGNNKVIPYVWGGSSFLEPYTQDYFYKDDGVWQRDEMRDPYTGYDCSELIMRMAQIAGIDFPWKTTSAIKHGQRKLTRDDLLEVGDIIWVHGHVMAISNIERNEIIEARGYGAGYGCVHRIKLNQAFVEVENYDDLLKRFHENEKITFKNKQGVPSEKADEFLLLKLIN